jgi:[ribosomal protein S18]-alanine N-acetyltransferase
MSFDDAYPYSLFVTFLNDLPNGFRLAVGDKDLIVGYCVLSRTKRSSVLMISSIAVRPDFQRQGVGLNLLRDAIRIAGELSALTPIEKILLQVGVNNLAAQSLYTKLGFRPVGKIRNYYGEGKDGIQMEFPLTDR